MIHRALVDRGQDAEVQAAGAAGPTVGCRELVIVGGALYAGRWHPEAVRFVREHSGELRTMPVWFFSSGPLDDTAAARIIPPVRGVAQLMDRVGARGHATFGGRLEPEAHGLIAHSMARTLAGDWRDEDQVRRWVDEILLELGRTNEARPDERIDKPR